MSTYLVYPMLAILTLVHMLMTSANASGYCAAGDSAHAKHDFPRALDCYKSAWEKDQACYEAAWKLSRAYNDVAAGETEKPRRKECFYDAMQCAQAAIQLNPQGSSGHLYYAIALGQIAEDTAVTEQLHFAKELRLEFEKVLSIQPDQDIALHALGVWHRRMATLNWFEKQAADVFLGGIPHDASVEKSLEYLRKAAAVAPADASHHFELAQTLELTGAKSEARGEYQKSLSLPALDADDKRDREIAQKRLDALR